MTEMIRSVVLLVIGFVLLIKGQTFRRGSSSVAKMLRFHLLLSDDRRHRTSLQSVQSVSNVHDEQLCACSQQCSRF